MGDDGGSPFQMGAVVGRRCLQKRQRTNYVRLLDAVDKNQIDCSQGKASRTSLLRDLKVET